MPVRPMVRERTLVRSTSGAGRRFTGWLRHRDGKSHHDVTPTRLSSHTCVT
jgi:hypothetical protein